MLPDCRTVLCVDDDPDDQLLVLDILKELAPTLRVASALNGVEALRFLEESKSRDDLPCLVIMDINMPLMDGRQALALIKKDKALDEVPVVVFTTSSDTVDQGLCEQYGVPFVTKPISHKGLYETIKKILSFCKKPSRA